MTESGLEELALEECWRLLDGQTVGRLAVAIKNKPDIFPVNFSVDHGGSAAGKTRTARTSADKTIVVRTAPGLKLAAATLGSAVAFEVDAIDAAHHTGWSVVVHGQAEEVESLNDRMSAADLPVEPWAGGPKDRYMRIIPTSITGRRIPATNNQ